MSKHTRQSVAALVAIVATLIGSMFGFSAFNTAEAGGGPSNIRLEVTPSIKTTSGTWPDTMSYIRSVESVQLLKAYWYKHISGEGPVAYTFGPDGSETHMQGDPSNIYYPTGMYLAYPDGTKNAFASAQWFSTVDGCDAPRMTISITKPRTSSAFAKGVIDNRSGKYKLFVSENGGSWTDIPIGDFYATSATQVAEIRVSVDGSSDSWKQCARLNWNVTLPWIEGTTPTPTATATATVTATSTPSPTPTATPSPKPVRFEVSPAQIFAYQGGDWVTVNLHIDSQGGKVSQTQASIKFDPSILEVVDMDPKTPGVQGSTNCGQTGLVGSELRFAWSGNDAVQCYATWRVKGRSPGTTSLSFVTSLTGAMLQEQKLPVQLSSGQFTVKPRPTRPIR